MKESSLKDGLSWLRCDDDDTVPLGGKSRALAERAMDFIVTMVRNPRQLKFRHLVAFLVWYSWKCSLRKCSRGHSGWALTNLDKLSLKHTQIHVYFFPSKHLSQYTNKVTFWEAKVPIKRSTYVQKDHFTSRQMLAKNWSWEDTEWGAGKLHEVVCTCLAHGVALLEVCPCWSRCVIVWVCLKTFLLASWKPVFCLPLEHDVEHSAPQGHACLEAAMIPTITIWIETHNHWASHNKILYMTRQQNIAWVMVSLHNNRNSHCDSSGEVRVIACERKKLLKMQTGSQVEGCSVILSPLQALEETSRPASKLGSDWAEKAWRCWLNQVRRKLEKRSQSLRPKKHQEEWKRLLPPKRKQLKRKPSEDGVETPNPRRTRSKRRRLKLTLLLKANPPRRKRSASRRKQPLLKIKEIKNEQPSKEEAEVPKPKKMKKGKEANGDRGKSPKLKNGLSNYIPNPNSSEALGKENPCSCEGLMPECRGMLSQWGGSG